MITFSVDEMYRLSLCIIVSVLPYWVSVERRRDVLSTTDPTPTKASLLESTTVGSGQVEVWTSTWAQVELEFEPDQNQMAMTAARTVQHDAALLFHLHHSGIMLLLRRELLPVARCSCWVQSCRHVPCDVPGRLLLTQASVVLLGRRWPLC